MDVVSVLSSTSAGLTPILGCSNHPSGSRTLTVLLRRLVDCFEGLMAIARVMVTLAVAFARSPVQNVFLFSLGQGPLEEK